jgi:hypothetical protein
VECNWWSVNKIWCFVAVKVCMWPLLL